MWIEFLELLERLENQFGWCTYLPRWCEIYLLLINLTDNPGLMQRPFTLAREMRNYRQGFENRLITQLLTYKSIPSG